MTSMPNTSGIRRRRDRAPAKPACPRASANAAAVPDTKNSSDSRQGELSIISGSIVVPACGDFTCQSQLT